jgi:metal-responsive CopG/Arc/MetJ family transcriptional regulator
MRLTIHIQDTLSKEVKAVSLAEARSVSSLVAEAVERYIAEKRRRTLGKEVLDLVGKGKVADGAIRAIDEGREEDGRP